MKCAAKTSANIAKGMSLVELLIAIGILAVSMMLIAAAFPAGVAMSIAVSDETTAQSVFQDALGIIRDNYSVASAGTLTDTEYNVIPDADVGGIDNRKIGTNGVFSWSALIRQMGTSGPGGNLCEVIVVVSRKPSGNPDFEPEPPGANTKIPELRKVKCTTSDDARTITIDSGDFGLVPNSGYMIDAQTGIVYSIISRNDGTDKTVTLLTEAPSSGDIGLDYYFWVVPGEYDGSEYGRVSPGIRAFRAMLYLP